VDYKCKECGFVSEIVIRGENNCQVSCEKCGSKNMVRVFAPVGFKKSSNNSDDSGSSSSCSSCSGGSCATCSSNR
jgi:putative FmdB family regulatory protein